MRILGERKYALWPRQHMSRVASLLCGAALLGMLLTTRVAEPQSLARPGWAGSGMTAERWWPHAVLCEVRPGSFAANADATSGSTLRRVASHMEDLQTLGIDAVLLRGLESGVAQPASAQTHSVPPAAVVDLDPRYGTLDEFDQLVSEAVRHGVRVLVELHRGATGPAMIADARFWLNRGVTGLALAGGDEAQTRALRGVLHSYIGERVLIAGGAVPSVSASATDTDLLARARTSRTPRRSETTRVVQLDQPDLLVIRLPAVAQGAAAMRQSLERAQALLSARPPVPLLSAGEGSDESASTRVFATALLGSGGAVLLAADDLDLRDAASAAPSSIFAWYRQWTGLHRGDPVMRTGTDTLLDHDAEGALVWVRRSSAGGATVVAICNLTNQPLHLSLVEDIARLRLRGSFLRTIARSDNGMGAMPLRAVTLPPFGVYVGELSR